MTRKQRRLSLIALAGAVLFLAAGLVLFALSDRISFFLTPGEVVARGVETGVGFRLSGLVVEGSWIKGQGTQTSFELTDASETITVVYEGILPDLFREGQGIVAEGMLDERGIFVADTVLAKHDEYYMPKAVAEALRKQGVWRGETAPSPQSDE